MHIQRDSKSLIHIFSCNFGSPNCGEISYPSEILPSVDQVLFSDFQKQMLPDPGSSPTKPPVACMRTCDSTFLILLAWTINCAEVEAERHPSESVWCAVTVLWSMLAAKMASLEKEESSYNSQEFFIFSLFFVLAF